MQDTLQVTEGREHTPQRDRSASPGRTNRTPLDDVQRQMRRQAAQCALSAQKPPIDRALLPLCMADSGVLLLARRFAGSGWRQALTVLTRLCPHMLCALPWASSTTASACKHPTAPAWQRCRRCSRGCSSTSRRQAPAQVPSLGTLLLPGPPGQFGACLLQHAAHCALHMVESEQGACPLARPGCPAAHLDLPLPIQPAHSLSLQHGHPAARRVHPQS